MTLKLVQFCDDPQKISTKSSYPQKILIFLKTPKNIEIQNFEPKKWAEPTYVWKYQSTPPPLDPLPLFLWEGLSLLHVLEHVCEPRPEKTGYMFASMMYEKCTNHPKHRLVSPAPM